MMSRIFLSAFLILGSLFALAHGEDAAGPHGGSIRMPGAYHTEVVLDGKHGLKVYLLDMNWKNPSVKDSSVSVTHGAKNIAAQCVAEKDHYNCPFPKSVDLTTKGKLKLESRHEGQKGNTAVYDLPLKFGGSKNGHSHH